MDMDFDIQPMNREAPRVLSAPACLEEWRMRHSLCMLRIYFLHTLRIYAKQLFNLFPIRWFDNATNHSRALVELANPFDLFG